MGDIYIEKPVFSGRKLRSKVSISDDLSKFLKNKELFIEYDTEINANESIFNIPLTATILPLAWLTGSDIHVGDLDKRFQESMEQLKDAFKIMYPKVAFSKIQAEETVENSSGKIDPTKRTGLLFSGGVDSMYSLITNIEHNPKLVMIWGVDNFPYPERRDHWEKTLSIYREYAETKGLEFYLIKTNVSQILNDRLIEHRFHREIYDGDIRDALQHSLILLPIAAPLSINRFDRFLIAASAAYHPDSPEKPSHPRAARPWTDEKIAWADITVKHDGFIDRNDKIRKLVEYHERDNMTLRVCLRSKLVDDCLNDNVCEKCLRTIAALSLAGYDPNKCGFKVDESTFSTMRYRWEKNQPSSARGQWRHIQETIPTVIEHDIQGSREFFEWLREYDFESSQKNYFYRDLYTAIPYGVSKYLDKVYRKFRISIHGSPDKREK